MNKSWIKSYRDLLKNPISSHPLQMALWCRILLMASYEERDFIFNGKKIHIKPGQFVTGRLELSKESGIPGSNIERYFNLWETGHLIGQQKTNKYRLITILNWNKYQTMDNKLDMKWTTSGQQVDTINKDNKDNKERGELSPTEFFKDSSKQKEIEDWLISKNFDIQLVQQQMFSFINYWTEEDSKGKQRWQKQQTFQIKNRFVTWFSRIK